MSLPSIRAVIIDDEEPARENLRFMLAEVCPEVEVVATADGPDSGRQCITEHAPDVVFLDIRMPSGSEGLDMLAAIPDPRFLVVFVTAFKDYAVEAFHANAVDYILKPIDPDELRAAVEKARDRLQLFVNEVERGSYQQGLDRAVRTIREGGASLRLAVDHAKGFKLFDPRDMVHLEADGNCTLIHFRDGTRYLDTRTLKVYEDMLSGDGFLRVHRSHLINVERLREYLREEGHWALMDNGNKVPIARNRIDAFLRSVRSH